MSPRCTGCRRTALFTCLLVLLPAPAGVRGQAVPGRQDARFADEYLQRGKLLDAEKHYRAALSALPASEAKEREHCHERLLALYPRLGRFDEAIEFGNQYAAQLTGAGKQTQRRAVLKQLGVCYLALGHYGAAQKRFEEALRDDPPDRDPLVTIEAHAYLARLAEKAKRPDDADEHWDRVRATARIALIKPPDSFTAKEITICTWQLAASLKDPHEAIAKLEALAARQEQAKDYADLSETLRRLAAQRTAIETTSLAPARDLRQAIKVYDMVDQPDPVRRGDLRHELARVLERYEDSREAADLRAEAAGLYAEALRNPQPAQADHQSAAASWKLHQLSRHAELYQKALKLADGTLLPQRTSRTALEESRLRAEQSLLNVYLGTQGQARTLLEIAKAKLEHRPLADLVALPRVLTSLAIAELHRATMSEEDSGRLATATALAQRVRKLYRDHALPDDLVLVETSNILGMCATWHGDYPNAIAEFRAGAELCKKLDHADTQRCNLLLSIAILHRARHELTEARTVCQEATDAYRKTAGKTAEKQLGYACFLCALVSIDAAPCQAEALAPLDALAKLGQRLGELCAEHRIERGPLRRMALHCQALAHLAHKDYAAAHALWLKLADMQEKAVIPLPDDPRRDPLLPQTLNWLGVMAEREDKADAAEQFYTRALQLQSDGWADPATHHSTLLRLAGLLDRRGEHAESRKLLEQALAVIEADCVHAWGGSRDRAARLAQFNTAAERLVEQCVRDGKLGDALTFSARSRGRGLFDQLLLAGVSLDSDEKRVRDQETALRKTVSRIRVGAPLLMADADSGEINRELARLDSVRNRYAEAERAIQSRSKAYAGLTVDTQLADRLRKHVVRPGRVVAAYHIGAERSYLMVLSDRSAEPEVWPLTVPARLLAAVQPAQRPVETAPITDANGAPAWHLDRTILRQLVANHLRQIDDPEFTTRGLQMNWDAAAATPGEVLEQIAETILPRAARVRLGQRGARQLIVVPDGALHRLPLESLVLRAGSTPRYVLDELPPMVYAPSLGILAHLAEHRPPRLVSGPPSLLTVCNPAYPQREKAQPHKRAHDDRILRGDLPLLPVTAEESQRVRSHFDPARVQVLDGAAATEAAVRKGIDGRQVVHLAVHGVAGRHGQSSAALFLVRGNDRVADDDGVLTLAEVYRLPLAACDLAVLTACETGTGPQQQLEAGATLAGAFLTAGARKVIASHWHVDDQSTAELMSQFFAEVMGADSKGVPYSRALQNARQKLRNSTQWSAPVYWAPCVLFATDDVLDTEPPVAGRSERVAEVVDPEPEWYDSEWFIPGVTIASGAALALLIALVAVVRRRRTEYRMPGTF